MVAVVMDSGIELFPTGGGETRGVPGLDEHR
jgi:hypothetical protein